MENICYFCTVKRFISLLKLSCLVILINLTSIARASGQQGDTTGNDSWLDSVEISLLTCGPSPEIYALYGHTALRIQDPARQIDWAVNWGIFNMRERFFVLRFVFGLTDYRVEVFPMAEMLADYAAEGRWIKEQYVRLTREEKKRLLTALEENLKPENVHYRYNYFYDNCTTRPRDMIVNCLVHNDYPATVATQTTYREEIHKWNEHHRWARFGNDLLLGVKSDVPLTSREAEFLPDNLRQSFDKWDRVYGTHYLLAPQAEVNDDEGLTPLACAIIVAVLIVALTMVGHFRKWSLLWLDSTLMVLVGLPGIILFAMLFSQHPTVNCNFQLLLLNPLALWGAFLLWQKKWRRKVAWVWLTCILICILGSIWQRYAEGIIVLAFALLIRCIDRLRHDE